MNESSPSFDEVAAFVKEFAGIQKSQSLQPNTRLEHDLGITGDDGDELLEEAGRRFRVELATADGGYRPNFGLRPNEYLFSSEGVDLIGITILLRWLSREPKPVVVDLTVGRLHDVIARVRAGQNPTC